MSRLEASRFAADRLTEVLARTVGRAEHPSGLARVTATANGELRDLQLHPALLAQGPDAVGRTVVETARLATDAAVQTSFNELAKALGDGVAIAVEAFVGAPPFRVEAERSVAEPESTSTPFAPAPTPPVTGPPARAQRPRPPAEEDEDAYFADPFRGQRRS
ncbi:hypothetical protein GCM10022243_06520 [Saccharothrix violaceirubra]|uniref:DNA-binding protein YbaB n=1 Tax=Saccharothrix violaceirubra TaxID=413306 RepID=A0A7W7WTF8_9PSEU|nr:YbaB/EbfC family nucleoid-associated protein [Saccharothrix violaceirubra]MBB4963064.1 DNA-binding protein YbaB [Saccharothrix violaceirubra]